MDLVIDIETLDTEVTSLILSAAVVAFDPAGNDTPESFLASENNFYTTFSLHESLMMDFSISRSTVEFWNKQSINALAEAAAQKTPLVESFKELSAFIQKFPKAKLWANSPSFDISILRSAFKKFNLRFPVEFWAERDIRTIKDICEVKLDFPSTLTKHNPMHDAIYEALIVQQGYANIKAANKPPLPLL